MLTRLKKIKYQVIFAALEGQLECGDQYLVKELKDSVLLAVVDGLGHGDEAAYAAKKAIAIMDANAYEPIETLFQLCDEALLGTRGAAITMIQLNYLNHIMRCKAVGNVMGVHWHIEENSKLKSQSFLLEGGIVGNQSPLLIPPKEYSWGVGDTLILATDGINKLFENESPTWDSPDKIAQRIFSNYRNENDDGLVLVAQLLSDD